MKTAIVLVVLYFASPLFAMEAICVNQADPIAAIRDSQLVAIPGLEIGQPLFAPKLLTFSGDLNIMSFRRGKRTLNIEIVAIADNEEIARSNTTLYEVGYNHILLFPTSLTRGITTPKAGHYSVLWRFNFLPGDGIAHISNGQFCLFG